LRADRVSRPFRDAYGYFAGLVHAKSENNRLRAENEQLRQQASQNAFAASENADLRKKLNFINSPSTRAATATLPPRFLGSPRLLSNSRC